MKKETILIVLVFSAVSLFILEHFYESWAKFNLQVLEGILDLGILIVAIPVTAKLYTNGIKILSGASLILLSLVDLVGVKYEYDSNIWEGVHWVSYMMTILLTIVIVWQLKFINKKEPA